MTERSSLIATESEISQQPNSGPPPNYGSIQQPDDVNADTAQMDDNKTTLKFFEKIGFSLGHIYNDLCAGVWFSYTLLFMQGVMQMPGPEAGAMVMLGQVGDAIFTPIIGVLTDKFSTKRKWHVFGKLSELVSNLFTLNYFCANRNPPCAGIFSTHLRHLSILRCPAALVEAGVLCFRHSGFPVWLACEFKCLIHDGNV